jgi:hypothetical protein
MRITHEQFQHAQKIIMQYQEQIKSDLLELREINKATNDIKLQVETAPKYGKYTTKTNIKNVVGKRLFNVINGNRFALGLPTNFDVVITVEDLVAVDIDDLKKLRNIGTKCIMEFEDIQKTINRQTEIN